MLCSKRHLVFPAPLLAVVVSLCGRGAACPQRSGHTFQAGLQCYWQINALLTAQDAQARCQNEGGQLAIVPSADADDFISSNLPLDSYPYSNCQGGVCYHYWVGYRDDVTRGTFTTWGWQSAPWVSPTLSDDSDVTSMCVRAKRSGSSLLWVNTACNDLRRALCSASVDPPPSPLTQNTWRGEPGRLPCDVIDSMTLPSPMQCAGCCQETSGCTTFNFHRQTGSCQLCAASTSALISSAGFRHYERQ